MKAIVYNGPGQVTVQEVPTPVAGAGEIVIKVQACAICGTDLRIISSGHRAVQAPRIIGHEICGTVHEIGAGVTQYRVGETVVAVTPVGCTQCRFCKADQQNMCAQVSQTVHSLGYYCDGGFAEYMRIPQEAVINNNLIKVPAHLSFAEAALTEPLSCVLNGQDFLHITSGDRVVIFGVGPIGCMHALVAKASGAEKIIMVDVSDEKIALAQKIGAGDVYINATKDDVQSVVAQETDNQGADVAIVACSSHLAQQQALEITGIRGRISFFGGLSKDKPTIMFDSNNVHYAEKSVYGAFASAHPHYHAALELIAQGKIPANKLITHTFSLDRFNEAVELIHSQQTLKVVITP